MASELVEQLVTIVRLTSFSYVIPHWWLAFVSVELVWKYMHFMCLLDLRES